LGIYHETQRGSLGVVCGVEKNMEKNTRRKIKVFRSDNGEEYTSDPFLQLCHNEGIERHFTARETPQQNGVAARMDRTSLEKVHCMLSSADISKSYWTKTLVYACYLINRLSSSVIGGKPPLQA